MFNKYNIKVFDYIYSINVELSAGSSFNIEKCKQELNEIIKKTGITQYEFWKENNSIIGDNQLYDGTTLNDTEDTKHYIYLRFPTIKLSNLSRYIDFKVEQLKKILANNPSYTFAITDLKKDLNIQSTLGIKEILDKCIEDEILISKGEYWEEIPNTKYGRIDEKKLKLNLNEKNNTNGNNINAENFVIINR